MEQQEPFTVYLVSSGFMQMLDLPAPSFSCYNACVLLLHVPLPTSAVCQETAQRFCVNAAFTSISRAQAGDPGPLECSPSYSIFQHKLKCGVLQSACRTWALLVCKECLWTAQLLRQAHMLHSNGVLMTFCYGEGLLILLSAAECIHAGKAVIKLLLQNWVPCSRVAVCMLASSHGCICSQVLSITDKCQFQLHLAEVPTFSMDSINVIIVQYAGVFRRSVCLFLLHLCAVWHGGGQKVSLTPI